MESLNSQNPAVVRTALVQCREWRHTDCLGKIPALLTRQQLKTAWPDAMQTAAALLNAPNIEIAAALQTAAVDKNPQLRFLALQTLMATQSPNTLRFLVRGLNDGDRRIRELAIRELGAYAESEVMLLLLRRYYSEGDRDLRTLLHQTVQKLLHTSGGEPERHAELERSMNHFLESDIAKANPSRSTELRQTVTSQP